MELRYVGDEDRQVSILPEGYLRALKPDDVFTIPDAVAESYSGQPYLYQPADGSEWPQPEAEADQAPETDTPAEPDTTEE